MNSEYSNYLDSRNNCQHVFIQNHSDAISAFERIFANFTAIRSLVGTGRDKNNKTHISLVPFLTLMQRQAAIAFDSLANYQSYSAWVNLRPCLEAALIIGKWIDDKNNAAIWQNREVSRESRRQYQEAYEGQGLRSRSLPRSESIQTVLKLSNDDFMHMNQRYYHRHLSLLQEGPNYRIEVQFFDDEAGHAAHLYAILHLLFVIQDALLSMFTMLFIRVNLETVGLREFESEFGGKISQLLKNYPDHQATITERGLWSI